MKIIAIVLTSMICCFVIFGKAATQFPAPSARPYLYVNLESRSTNEHWLVFKLQNTSAQSIKVYKFVLPWSRPSLTLSVTPTVGRWKATSLSELRPIDDAVPHRVTIPAGKTVEGRMRLDKLFKQDGKLIDVFSPEAKEQEFVIFWSYRLKTVDGGEFERVGGMLNTFAETK